MVFFQLVLYLLVLVGLIVKVQVHVGNVLGEDLFQLAHALSPDAPRVVDLWDLGELDVLWHFLAELKLKRVFDDAFLERFLSALFRWISFFVLCRNILRVLVLLIGWLLLTLSWRFFCLAFILL
jgi:hypothetical protein